MLDMDNWVKCGGYTTLPTRDLTTLQASLSQARVILRALLDTNIVLVDFDDRWIDLTDKGKFWCDCADEWLKEVDAAAREEYNTLTPSPP